MSEQVLESYQYVSPLFKNPYCQCALYEKEQERYRVFQLTDEEIIINMMQCIQESEVDYSLYGGKFYLITPYEDTITIEEWKKEKHTIKENITLCEEILFAFQREQLPEKLFMICMDGFSIGIDKNNLPHILVNPNFSRLKYKTFHPSVYTDCAKLLMMIISSSKKMYRRYQKLPQEYLVFQEKIKKRSYQSITEILQDILPLKYAFEKKPKHWNKIARIFSTLLIVLTILVMVAVLLFYYMDWINSTYDGLHSIGGNKVNNDEETTSQNKE